MMYRIWCSYSPHLRRAGGGDKSGPKRACGAWFVVDCVKMTSFGALPVYKTTSEVGVCSPTPRRKGTRVSPYKLLCGYQQHMREVRARTSDRLCATLMGDSYA